MKRTLLSATFALALTGSFALAQQQTPAPDATPTPAAPISRHHAPDPARETAHLTKQLNLTQDQAAKLQPIFADRDQKLTELRGNTNLSKKDMHHQMKAIHEGTMQQLQSVLTSEQIQQMKAMHHRHGGKNQPDQAQPAPGV